MIKIRVPATSANMGPGFDSLGIALNLYNTYSFYYGEEDGEKSLMREASDLVFQSIERTPEPVKVTVESHIPMSRGLGSSAACIVAGVMAANVYLNSPLGLTELLQLATQAEGHPDNVAPALFGGITASLMQEGKAYTQRFLPGEDWDYVAMIPDFYLSTRKAREVLPREIPFEHGVWNASRSGFLILALMHGRKDLLPLALEDRLHENYRKSLIPDFDDIKKALRRTGEEAIYLSGAGPTMLCISENGEQIKKLFEHLPLKNTWEVKILHPDLEGAKILR